MLPGLSESWEGRILSQIVLDASLLLTGKCDGLVHSLKELGGKGTLASHGEHDVH